jgi:hypothetical protein
VETIENYNSYKKKVLQDFQRVKSFFPSLTLTILPTIVPSKIFFSGLILPPKMNTIVSPADLEKYGFKIKGVYPFKFPDELVEVYDIDSKICWDKIPHEHQHVYPDGRICTHHPDAEINSIPEQDRAIAVLFSAWQLYYQVKIHIEEGSKWVLKDLPHGDEVNKVLRREGWK